MPMKDAIPDELRPYLKAAYHQARVATPWTAAGKALLTRRLHGPDQTLLRQVDPVVSPNDSMQAGGWVHYFEVGLDAVRWIDAALASRPGPEPSEILDLPCGWGRVMRFLAARYPNARLAGCDILSDGVEFCTRRWGARPILSMPSFDELDLDARFDLIWCGSLVTHLDAPSLEALLRLFARSLTPDGVAVISAHGEFVARRLRNQDPFYAMPPEAMATIVRGYDTDGFGYAHYPVGSAEGRVDSADAVYGVSLTSRPWLQAAARRAGLAETYFVATAWDRHHDVYGLTPAAD